LGGFWKDLGTTFYYPKKEVHKVNGEQTEGKVCAMVNEVFDELYQCTVRAYLDVLILQELKDNTPQETKELMSVINTKYCSDISWGILLSTLIGMQKKGLVEEIESKKALYTLSSNGRKMLTSIAGFASELKDFLNKIAK
jgi:DNA-binding HxlR family transcriptional regulator